MRLLALSGLLGLVLSAVPKDNSVDITSLEWIKQIPLLSEFKGIRVPVGKKGLVLSYEYIQDAFRSQTGLYDAIKVPFFEEIQRFFHESPKFAKRYLTEDDFHIIDVLRFAASRNDFEMVQYFKHRRQYPSILVPETAEQLTKYLREHPENYYDIMGYGPSRDGIDFFFNLGLNQEQVKELFQEDERIISHTIKMICDYTDPSKLAKPEIKQQVTQIYNLLSSESQSKVKMTAYCRSLLSTESAAITYSAIDYWNILQEQQILTSQDPSKWVKVIKTIAKEQDSLVIDWFLGLGNQTLATDLTKQAHAIATGHANFLSFLQSPSIELQTFPEVVWVLAELGTAEEFEAFLSRANDAMVGTLLKAFFKIHAVPEEFAKCAELLLDCVDGIKIKPKEIQFREFNDNEMKLLTSPAILARLQDMNIKLVFTFNTIKRAIKNDQAFQNLLSFKEIYADSWRPDYNFELGSLYEIVDKVVLLTGASIHELIRDACEKSSISANTDLTHLIKIFLLLKRWKKESPEEVDALLRTEPRRDIEKLLKSRNISLAFDAESKALLTAYLSMVPERTLSDSDSDSDSDSE